MARQHDSIFTYNITRPYPYKWFTPVTLVAGILLTALFSWLNYASSGFEMVANTSTDPNTTIADPGVLHGLPKLLTGKFKPNCQSASIPVNSQFFTNNTGLEYELLEVARDVPGVGSVILPALTYSNNVLEHCEITAVQLEISWSDRTGIQFPITEYGTVVRTYATCNISTPDGPVTISVTNGYDLVPATINIASLLSTIHRNTSNLATNFIGRNATSRASLYWGESMFSAYWSWFVDSMDRQHSSEDDGSRITKGWLAFRPSSNQSAVDILDPYFLEIDWRLVIWKPDGNFTIYWPGADGARYATAFAESGYYPSTWWLPAEKLAKSAWSTVLVDLGQSKQSNILLDDDKLAMFTSDFIARHNSTGNVRAGPETSPYNATNSDTGPLGSTPAVINTEYICNVPRRKATSTIAWLVIVANLVFLQAGWKLFKLAVDSYLVNANPRTQHCAGCQGGEAILLEQDGGQLLSPRRDDHELSPLGKQLMRPHYYRQTTE